MIDYKTKQLRIKTKRDEITKLMVLANKKIKKIKVGNLAIQPMERKENYEDKPDIPLINKITAPDWNRFIDNIQFLNMVETENSRNIAKIQTEVELLRASNSLIKAKTEPTWLVENVAYSEYQWKQLLKLASFPLDYGNRYMGTPYAFRDLKEIGNTHRKWIIDYQNSNGEVKRNIIFGKMNSKTITYQPIGSVGADIIDVFFLEATPLSYISRLIGILADGKDDIVLGIPSSLDNAKNIDISNIETAKYLNIGIMAGFYRHSSRNNDGSAEIPSESSLFPTTDTTTQRWLGDPPNTFSALPITNVEWRPKNIGYAVEEPVDLVGMTNWMYFILQQLQINSKFTEKWGAVDEQSDPVISDFLNNTQNNSLSLCSIDENPFEIRIQVSGGGTIITNFIKKNGETVNLLAYTSALQPTTAVPSSFFNALLTPRDDYSGQFSGGGTWTDEQWKTAYNNYIEMYFDLWTNKNHNVIDWKWELSLAPLIS